MDRVGFDAVANERLELRNRIRRCACETAGDLRESRLGRLAADEVKEVLRVLDVIID
jgi:hypothetical protein